MENGGLVMALVQSLVGAYSRAIYKDGTRKFSEIRVDYADAVKQFAAASYSDAQIIVAGENGWITETEYDETMTYKYPDGVYPSYKPPVPI